MKTIAAALRWLADWPRLRKLAAWIDGIGGPGRPPPK